MSVTVNLFCSSGYRGFSGIPRRAQSLTLFHLGSLHGEPPTDRRDTLCATPLIPGAWRFRFPSNHLSTCAPPRSPFLRSQPLFSFSSHSRAAPERTQVTLLSTTDLHGHIFPINYATNEPSNEGFAKVASLIRKARAAAGEVLLVDCGDTIQGTPLVYYHNRINN
ncbi:MAG TPA: hypothetical protein PLV87_10765, partial [Opitutaceae bacterium]|nr:hypothetical protein [Opitutaceae bacterium]